MNSTIVSQAMLVLLAGLSFISCSHETKNPVSAVRNVILCEVSQPGESETREFSGVVEEGKSVNAAFMTGGKILKLYVNEGDRVSNGQLLASLDDSDYRIGVNQLRVQYDQMVAEKKRIDEMYARHNIAPNDYEKFQAGFEQLKLQLEMADNKLGYTKLYAPTAGFISHKYMQPGELVDAGTPIYKITDDSQLEVSVDLPLAIYLKRNDIEEAFGKLADGRNIPLKIAGFTPDADNNQLYHMKLDIPASSGKDLTTGMNMKVILELKTEANSGAMVPSRSVFYDNGESFVWKFNDRDSTISRQKVTVIGQPQGNMSMVSGISGKEKIVSAGVKQLKEGEKVNILTSPVAK